MQYELNKGQQLAADSIIEFLLDPSKKELVLSGMPGTGKTVLISWFLNEGYANYIKVCKQSNIPILYPERPVLTATTNKAAEVLSNYTKYPTKTIHSYLGLILKENYDTGSMNLLMGKSWTIHYNQIVFIDECSMIDPYLMDFIHKGLHGCKVIYVGDKDQLAPIKCTTSPVFSGTIPIVELTECMRMKNHPELIDLAAQLRYTVKTKEFNPIKLCKGVIDLLEPREMQETINTQFLVPNSINKIVTYTNKKSLAYNDYIKYDLRQYTEPYRAGEHYVVGSALVQTVNNRKTTVLGTDDEIIIDSVNGVSEFTDSTIPFQIVSLTAHKTYDYNPITFYAPINSQTYLQVLKEEAKRKNWKTYFKIRELVADIRLADSCTIHKVQGSTFDNIFVDVTDLSTCTNPSVAARLLYVVCTRAKEHVYFYGKLAPKYGGIVSG